MNKPVKLLTIAITSLVLANLAIETSLAKLSSQSKLLLKGIGDIPIGLTVAETAKAAGVKLVNESPQEACYYVKPEKTPKDVGFMVVDGRVARVDVWRGSKLLLFEVPRSVIQRRALSLCILVKLRSRPINT
jgi:hypothetical protein